MIRIRDLRLKYSAAAALEAGLVESGCVLNGLSLDVVEGEILGVIGRSGSGKSTLLRVMSGLEPFQEGSIQMGDSELGPKSRQAAQAKYRAQTGVVFQDFHLFPHYSALQNVALALKIVRGLETDAAEREALAALEKVSLRAAAHQYPETLSGGQKQRVAIARALALKPRVLLYDEPTSALDPDLRFEILDVIRGLKSLGITQIVVTHEIPFARRVSDRIAVLAEGKICEVGTPDQVLDRSHSEATKELLKRNWG